MSPDSDRSFRLEEVYEPVVAASVRIRHRLGTLLADAEVAAQVIQDALLVVEELVANVIDHARTPFRLTVQCGGATLRIQVRDRDRAPARIAALNPVAARGRGLRLVAGIADNWGCEESEDGKTVWAVLAI
ncbi:ATP-binding protein [Cryptosporangium sp. NPDC048952]|uniref:ATP-binding protein n=1 Tax=Cryptosporangium sp. NPDC048952 TaxID=3363961 RepID=UPI00371608F2